MKGRDLPAFLWLVVAWTIPIAAFLMVAPPSHADTGTEAFDALNHVELAYVTFYGKPVICDTIDTYPTIIGVQGVTEFVMGDGFMEGEAQTIIAASVEAYCPGHFGLVVSAAQLPLGPAQRV